MPKFLNTSATNYYLEELIKNAKERLILISPFLKINDRIRELLEDKNRMKIDVRIVYGKSELHPQEINWLKSLTFVRTSFCKNLHAKCYLNEEVAIITSLNLYDFSQVNNNEMGILLTREADSECYRDAYDEAQRIVRVSDEVRIAMEMVSKVEDGAAQGASAVSADDAEGSGTLAKLTSAKLAAKLGIKTKDLMDRLAAGGYLELRDTMHYLTDLGKSAGGEFRKGPGGFYFLWPIDFNI
ncbi:phospholipase D family protein [Pseudomonas aeruginosa]|nr:phospholipase D family protein [[Pseudomonas] sp. BICA1-14]KJS79051.1 MAG: DNA repair protein [[Pseudomonas] sp. BICA1-14]HBN9859412.1 phospholipase D family protein [Pseudomonas aeruginosa]HBO8078192.1 DNA repair protein [Pseudomonas aeruginosa]HBO8799790.1 DNA repair protein [Pseudomonas aeruginosa]